MNPPHESSAISRMLMRRRSWFIALFQAALIVISLLTAWLLRFDFTLPYRSVFFAAAPILILIRLAAISYFGLLHGWWKYAGVNDAVSVLKAVATGSLAFWILMRYVMHITAFPRSIYPLEAILTAGALAGVRLLSRVLVQSFRKDLDSYKKVILIGAGSAADDILREIMRAESGYTAVACVDDDASKHGLKLHGVQVMGTVEELPCLLQTYAVDEVLIAIPTATGKQMRRFVEICKRADVKFRTVPALKEIISGRVIISQLREVKLEDLLGRECAQIDLESVRKQVAGRVVLVTGAAGSIGSELCRQLLEFEPARLTCLDQSETGIFFLRLDLARHENGTQLAFCVADVRDPDRMRTLFAEHKPAVVFHAAAYKHVPIMELNVHEAIENNVFAFLDLLDVAEDAGCQSFVQISSDKAVNPTSVMGASKRICELIISARPSNGMRCVAVRFGNVLGSSGSVVPVLKQQLRNREPLTVTHPEVKRFFMTTREAVALVLQAFAIGHHADILVLDMGEPVRILDLARELVRLSGESEENVEIQFTGLRDGEKLEEELFYPNEEVLSTSCEKIKRTHSMLNGWLVLQRHLDELRASLSIDGAGPIRAKIKEIVPQYTPPKQDATESQTAASADALLRHAAASQP